MTKIAQLLTWYSNLRAEELDGVKALYHEQARFRDPFNDVRGHAAITAIFRHMFETTDQPGFEIINVMQERNTAWVEWKFRCSIRRKRVEVQGASRVDFGSDGRVISHLDYWDASELLAQLPLVGKLVSLLRSKLSTLQQKNQQRPAI